MTCRHIGLEVGKGKLRYVVVDIRFNAHLSASLASFRLIVGYVAVSDVYPRDDWHFIRLSRKVRRLSSREFTVPDTRLSLEFPDCRETRLLLLD